MSVSSAWAATDGTPADPEALRRLRHKLRTPVNHLLGYAELLLEDAESDGGAWCAQLERILVAGRAALDPIDAVIEALRERADPVDAACRVRALMAEIGDACDLLDAEADRQGAEDAAADLAVIRGAATRLLELIAGSDAPAASRNRVASQPVVPAEPSADTRVEPGVLLIVDDDAQNRDFLSRRLARMGHAVEAAPGGREALALLRAETFDLVLLDVMMPEMDGFEVLARLKADAALRELPVIMLSALDEIGAAVRCIELGADDYLTKPVDSVLLRARIGACLERKRLRDTEVAYLRQAAQVTGPAIIARALVADPLEAVAVGDEAMLREAIAAVAEWIDLPKGERLFVEGDPGACMFVVESGRLRIEEADERGQVRALGEAGRGATLGELEMLTGQPRATTATAVRDARLARIGRDAFQRLSEAYPRLLTRTTSDVIDRLREAFQRRPDPQQVTAFALVPIRDGVPIAETARLLATALGSHGDTLLLDRPRLGELLGHDVSRQLGEDPGTARLAAWLNEIEVRHRYVIYQADPEPSAWTRRCLRQADRVLLVGGGRPGAGKSPLADELARNAHGAPVDLLLLHAEATSRPAGTGEWLDRWPVRQHLHLRLGDSAGLERTVRRLTGTSIDLVLGGGGARGWAHVGVLRAVEEAGIPIDTIGGTSMGALIAGASALGLSWREIQEQARAWSSPRRLFDYTLPVISLIAGNKITSMLHAVYGDARIEDLWRGFFCVSSSLTYAQPVVHRRGPLWKAVRGSISIPGFLPPIREEADLLIDGAYLNNMPTDLMRDLYGSGVVVAVSVSQAAEMPGEVDTGPAVSGWDVLWRRLAPWASQVPPPGLAATIMRASSLSGDYNLGASIELADLVIAPSLERYGTLDFAAYQSIIDAGYEAASRQIESWQRARVVDTSPRA